MPSLDPYYKTPFCTSIGKILDTSLYAFFTVNGIFFCAVFVLKLYHNEKKGLENKVLKLQEFISREFLFQGLFYTRLFSAKIQDIFSENYFSKNFFGGYLTSQRELYGTHPDYTRQTGAFLQMNQLLLGKFQRYAWFPRMI